MDMDRLQKNDHEEFKFQLSILEEINNDDKLKDLILNKLKMIVLAHRMAEEEVYLSQLLEKNPELEQNINKTKKEHKLIEDLFDALSTIKVNDNNWRPILKRLKKVIESDIFKEEEMLLSWNANFSQEASINYAKEMIIKKIEFEHSLMDRLGHRIKEKIEQIEEIPSKIAEKIN
jgi:hypothetical protein